MNYDSYSILFHSILSPLMMQTYLHIFISSNQYYVTLKSDDKNMQVAVVPPTSPRRLALIIQRYPGRAECSKVCKRSQLLCLGWRPITRSSQTQAGGHAVRMDQKSEIATAKSEGLSEVTRCCPIMRIELFGVRLIAKSRKTIIIITLEFDSSNIN